MRTGLSRRGEDGRSTTGFEEIGSSANLVLGSHDRVEWCRDSKEVMRGSMSRVIERVKARPDELR